MGDHHGPVPGRKPTLSPLDLRVKSGLKLVASGQEALAFTPRELERRRYLARARCACGHRDFIPPKVLQRRPDEPLAVLLKNKLICKKCGDRSPVVEIVNPWRDNLE
jgi:hypothetical protein